jgi:cell fate regulator YaaT (PSP1 superfamily)
MSELRSRIDEQIKTARNLVEEHRLSMKIVDVEPILGEELLTFYFISEDRVDFRKLVSDLAAKYSTRIEMRQVGSRDESRLVADYERCGQHCCCKNFLKVLSPVSMRAAKQQKQTLDPKKISGRCGRLMCCLRYEDQTYRELKKNLPHKKTRVGTVEGPGIVLEGKILTQLVLVELEHDQRRIAIPLEELSDPETCPRPWEIEEVEEEKKPKRRKRNRNRKKKNQSKSENEESKQDDTDQPKKKRRRRRRRKRKTSDEPDKS